MKHNCTNARVDHFRYLHFHHFQLLHLLHLHPLQVLYLHPLHIHLLQEFVHLCVTGGLKFRSGITIVADASILLLFLFLGQDSGFFYALAAVCCFYTMSAAIVVQICCFYWLEYSAGLFLD